MRSCDSRNCMSSSKAMARLVAVCQREQVLSFDKRQIPIKIDENLTMKLQFDDTFMNSNHCGINKKSKTYDTFVKTYKKLTNDELQDTLSIPISQIKEYIPRCISCIGCRTSIDSFIKSLIEHHHPALEPLFINEKGFFTMKHCYSSSPENIYTLFYTYGSKLNSFIESIPKSKKNRRCNIHLFEKTKSISNWEVVWDSMNKECRDEVTLVENDGLFKTLENYLYKHRFCSECKLKVSEAYDLLINNCDHKHQDRNGFCPTLYEGLRTCANDKHIHIDVNKEFIGNLIARAEPDIDGSQRERHAKTLDIAQEEVLTCIGIYLFERFDKIYRTMRSEEQTWQLLFYIVIDCLRLNFETAIDRKQDFSMTLENLCEEFRVADEMKLQKKQQKRAKRKARRQIKPNEDKDTIIIDQDDEKISSEIKFPSIRARANSCCSCLCYYCHEERSNSLLPIHTMSSSNSFIKSPSCPSLLLYSSECSSHQVIKGHKICLSSSLETLFSSVSTRDCVCHDRNLDKQTVLCDECPTSSSTSCLRCSSTRTDLGYSSGQDDVFSSGPCECSSVSCDTCLIKCPLHEVDENCSDSILSTDACSNICCIHDRIIDCSKPIELYDTTRKNKVKLQLSHEYPFFTMDLKQIWDDPNSSIMENKSYISTDDINDFLLHNTHLERKRAQLRDQFKLKWQQQANQRFPFKTWTK
ncbi:unnamed protein product [Adineta steineri]|uniref:Gametogenetin-binding protein 2 n=1 Tax=Adineta steineri TaxID=433720 RepID=A0A813UME7_9BILA|nr:unnamed protein product [Adineta steineri]